MDACKALRHQRAGQSEHEQADQCVLQQRTAESRERAAGGRGTRRCLFPFLFLYFCLVYLILTITHFTIGWREPENRKNLLSFLGVTCIVNKGRTAMWLQVILSPPIRRNTERQGQPTWEQLCQLHAPAKSCHSQENSCALQFITWALGLHCLDFKPMLRRGFNSL